MQTLNQPSLLLKPFAEQGDKNTIPSVNTDPSEPQRADFTSGFPAIVSLPPDQGGLPPERKDFNALGYLTTLYDFFYQAGGTFTFDPTTSTAIGGYPLGARLWYTNSDGTSMILRSTVANNTNNFLTDPSVIGRTGDNKPWVIENFMGIESVVPLLSFNWFDHAPDDASWLRADTWSWQNGGVYKSAYDYLSDQYTNGTQKSDFLMWTNVVGSPTITNGVVSNFSQTNYLYSPYKLLPGNKTWSLETSVNTGSISSRSIIFGCKNADFHLPILLVENNKFLLLLSSNGTSWDISINATSSLDIPLNQDFSVRLSFDGSKYTVDCSTDNWTTTTNYITVNSSTVIYQGDGEFDIGYTFGAASQFWIGSVDLTKTKLTIDNVVVWRGSSFLQYTEGTNGMKIVSSANAGAVQDMYEASGVAWYYVLDTTNTQFKLPRTKYGFVGYRDGVGKFVEQSLPNIIGHLGLNGPDTAKWWSDNGWSGALYPSKRSVNYTENAISSTNSDTALFNTIEFNSSLASSVYQDNAPVQQRATQMYLYFYVGNTIRNQTEIDVGEISEALNGKWDSSNMKVVSSLPENPQTGVFYFIK